MDERLVGQFDWTKGLPNTTNLCVYAVLQARIDRANPTRTDADEYLNVYLGHVLGYAFRPTTMVEITNGDYLGLVERLKVQPRKRRSWSIPQYIGDRLLFYTSQNSRVGRAGSSSLSKEAMVGYGRLAYAIAAQNARCSRQSPYDELFERLSADWERIEPLLTKAGDILGFDPELYLLVKSGQSVVTIDDCLKAITLFNEEPTLERWLELEAVVNQRKRIDKQFTYVLPPRPNA